MLNIQNIDKYFNKTQVLDDINLTVNKGDCYGLLGRNGAGKTTLLNILVGNFKQSEGNVFYFDQLINIDTDFKEKTAHRFFH